MEERKVITRWFGHARNAHLLELFTVLNLNLADDRTVGKIDDHHKFIIVIQTHEGHEIGLVGITQPDDPVVAKGCVLFPKLNQVAVDIGQRRTFLWVPKDRKLVEQGGITGFRGVAHFHAVI